MYDFSILFKNSFGNIFFFNSTVSTVIPTVFHYGKCTKARNGVSGSWGPRGGSRTSEDDSLCMYLLLTSKSWTDVTDTTKSHWILEDYRIQAISCQVSYPLLSWALNNLIKHNNNTLVSTDSMVSGKRGLFPLAQLALLKSKQFWMTMWY